MIKEGYLKVRPLQAIFTRPILANPGLLLQYKGSAFKVANFDRWLVIVSGQQAIEELRQATEDELSMKMAVEDVGIIIIQSNRSINCIADSLSQLYNGAKYPRWSILPENHPGMCVQQQLIYLYTTDHYHVPIIRNQLTKNIGIYFPEVQDEIMQAFDDEIRPTAGKFSKLRSYVICFYV
jgi:hypothetical protein